MIYQKFMIIDYLIFTRYTSCGNDVIPKMNAILQIYRYMGPVMTESGNRFSKEKCLQRKKI